MIAALCILYVLIGTAVATETVLRMREYMLRSTIEFRPDTEDLAVVVIAGIFWPMTLVVGAWLWLYSRRKARQEEAA